VKKQFSSTPCNTVSYYESKEISEGQCDGHQHPFQHKTHLSPLTWLLFTLKAGDTLTDRTKSCFIFLVKLTLFICNKSGAVRFYTSSVKWWGCCIRASVCYIVGMGLSVTVQVRHVLMMVSTLPLSASVC